MSGNKQIRREEGREEGRKKEKKRETIKDESQTSQLWWHTPLSPALGESLRVLHSYFRLARAT